MKSSIHIPLALIAPQRANILEQKKNIYSLTTDREAITKFQLDRFNSVWKFALSNSLFYKDWSKRHGLPDQIGSIKDLMNFPILTKETIRSHEEQISRDVVSTKGIFYVSTGGSTGTPVRFPTSKAEKNLEYGNTYLAKSWWGINPFDHVVQLWGHSHLFGTGLPGKLKELRRKLYDRVIRTYRLNAYNMTEDRIGKYALEIIRQSPQVIIGYTSAVFKVAQYAKTHGLSLGNPELKAVIVTAETATGPDIALITEIFEKPVVIEYGMAETGVIAYSRTSTESLHVLWDSFLCIDDREGLTLSTLYDRCFPLINYSTGDQLSNIVCCNGSILGFSNIKGRVQENITLWNADRTITYIVSGILIVHILKSYPGVHSVTSVQDSEGCISIYVSTIGHANVVGMKKLLVDALKSEFGPVALDAVQVVDARSETQLNCESLAGKHRAVIPGSRVSV